MLSLRYPCLICVFLALTMTPVFATTVTYVDPSAWLAASSGVTTIGFDGLAPSNSQTSYSAGLVIPDGPTFEGLTSTFNQLFVYNWDPGPSGWFNFGSGPILVGPTCCSTNSYINITLPHPVTAVGFDLMTGSGNGVSYNIALNNLNYIYTSVPTAPWPSRVFWGITSDTPITSVNVTVPTLNNNGIIMEMDNFSYGTAGVTGGSGDTGGTDPGETPEACTLLLIGTGLMGLRLFRKRIRSMQQAF